MKTHLPTELGAKQAAFFSKVENNLAMVAMSIVFVGLIGVWISVANGQIAALFTCTLVAGIGAFLLFERQIATRLSRRDPLDYSLWVDNTEFEIHDAEEMSPLRRVVGYVSLVTGIFLVVSLFL